MNAFVICFVAFLAAANAYPSAHILQGPSSKTTLLGPDGSVISAVAPGGQVVHEEHPGVVAHTAPVVSYSAPLVAHAAPFVHGVVAPIAQGYAAHHGHANTIVSGPSGTIVSGHSVAHSPLALDAYAVPVHTYADNHHEGQYVHDHSENLYDDGSYKPHIYY